jgi:hypothetical protein
LTANKIAYDTDMAARLWQVSADLVGIASSDTIPAGHGRHK